MNHIDTDDIVAYVAGRLGDEESMRLEIHLADCLECDRRVKAHYHIKENFDQVWEAWMSRSNASEMIRSRMARALKQSMELARHAELRDRIEGWLKKLRAKAGLAWCAAVDTSTRATREMKELLTADINARQRTLGLQPEPVPCRAAVRTRGKAKTRAKVTVSEQSAVKKVDIIEGREGCTIRVRVRMLAPPWPLLALIDKHAKTIFVNTFEKSGPGLSAEFKNVPKGEYALFIEG